MKPTTLSFLILLPLFTGVGSLFCMSESDDVIVISGDEDRRGWIGVSIQDMTPRLAESMKIDADEGALVEEVIDDSPAETAGIKTEDIIISFNGDSIHDADDLIRAVRDVTPGKTAEVIVLRNTGRESLTVEVGERPRRYRSFAITPDAHWSPHGLLHGITSMGLRLQDLSPQLGEYFGAPKNEGVLVSEVEDESAGSKAGFKAGDIILKVQEQTIREADDVWDEVEEYKEGDKVSFEILRNGARKTLTMEVVESGHEFWFRGPRSGSFRFEHDFDYEINLEELEGLEDQLREELEDVRPEMDRLRIRIRELRKEIREINGDLRDKIRSTVSGTNS